MNIIVDTITVHGQCIGCTENKRDFMVSVTGRNECGEIHSVGPTTYPKIFDIFLTKEQMKVIVEKYASSLFQWGLNLMNNQELVKLGYQLG